MITISRNPNHIGTQLLKFLDFFHVIGIMIIVIIRHLGKDTYG